MIESPLLDELKEVFRQMGKQEAILEQLEDRFGSVPEDIAAAVKGVSDLRRLRHLNRLAGACSDLNEFRTKLSDS